MKKLYEKRRGFLTLLETGVVWAINYMVAADQIKPDFERQFANHEYQGLNNDCQF